MQNFQNSARTGFRDKRKIGNNDMTVGKTRQRSISFIQKQYWIGNMGKRNDKLTALRTEEAK